MQIFGGLGKPRALALGAGLVLVGVVGLALMGRRPEGRAPGKPAAIEPLEFEGFESIQASETETALRAKFSEVVAAESAGTFIEVEPKIGYRVTPWDDGSDTGCELAGGFQPGLAYRITFHHGLIATNGSRLAHDVARVVNIPDRPASLAIRTTSNGHYLSTKGKLLVPVTTVNIHKFTVTVEQVYANNLVYHAALHGAGFSGYWANQASGDLRHEVGRKEYAVRAPLNQSAETLVDLRDFTGEASSGAYRLVVTGDHGGTTSHLVVVTDLGIAVKGSERGWLVWANSLRTLAAIGGADVRVYSKANQELWHGLTDTNGLAQFELDPDRASAGPFVVTVAKDGDLSYLTLEGNQVNVGAEVGGRPYLRRGYEAFVFTDRGIYRPGETAHIKAVVRGPDAACPASFPVQLHVIRPDGKRDRLLSAILDEFGAAEFAVGWADYAATGSYRLELKLPGQDSPLGLTAVGVEEFVPPQIAVKTEMAETRGRAEEEFAVAVSAMHLFGRPAAGNAATVSIEYMPEPFAPANWPGYAFGDPERSFSAVREELGHGQLDADGRIQFTARVSAAWRPPAALRAVAAGSVQECGGRTVSAYAGRALDVYPYYIGIKLAGADAAVTVNETQRLSIVTVAPAGRLATEAKALRLSLSKIVWSTVLKRESGGRYSFHSERQLLPVLDRDVAVTGGKGASEFALKDYGQYLLSVHDPAGAAASSITFHVGSGGQVWEAWSLETPDRVDLQLDKSSYAAGEEATLLIKAPFSGKALLTVESDCVLEQRVVEMEQNTASIKLPVRAAYRPNVYCSISLIRPVQPGEKWAGHRAVGTVPLVVAADDRRFSVGVSVPKEIRPQERLRVDIRVPVDAAEVAVAAVDEGVCALTGFRCPDPVEYFWSQRRLGVELFDLYGLLMPEVEEAIRGDASAPGGDAASSSLRRRLNPINTRRFRPVALWSSVLVTNGAATAVFEVPEFTGQLRVMAVAIGREQFGSTQATVLVRRPLIVRSSLPRFLAPGDAARLPVQVFNETGRDGEAVVTVTGERLTASTAEKRLTVKNGQSAATEFGLTAEAAPGAGKVRLSVTLGGEKYAEDFELPVRPATARATSSGVGSVAPGTSVEIAWPAGWLAGTDERELWCSGMPAVQLSGGLEYLLRYPYGCIEQTTSSAFPLLYLADLAEQIRPGNMGHEEVEHFVQAGLDRVLSMQLGDGGFSMWPRGRQPYEWGSIYATHFLAEAARAGYAVPKDRLQSAGDYVRGLLLRPTGTNYDLGLRAYACLALAVAGKPDHGWNARLAEERALLDPSAQADLAAALAAAGRRREASAFLGAVRPPGNGSSRRERGGCLGSSVRDQSRLLGAWLDLDPASPVVPVLARRLEAGLRNGRWQTTQDNAQALVALGRYARRLANTQKPFTAMVLPGYATVTREKDLHVRPEGPVTLTNAGPGTVYYYWRAEGVPAGGQAVELDRGLTVRRRWLDIGGRPLGRRALKQGELVVVEIRVGAGDSFVDNVVIEDLLPAGLEIENTELQTSQLVTWLKDKQTLPVRHLEARDDRLLLFAGEFCGEHTYYYAARAVTIGRFIQPAITASCMYDPEIRSVNGAGRLEVQ